MRGGRSAESDVRLLVEGSADAERSSAARVAAETRDVGIWHFEGRHVITDFKGVYEEYEAALG